MLSHSLCLHAKGLYVAVLGVLVPVMATSAPASLSQQAVTHNTVQINWLQAFMMTDSLHSRGVAYTLF